MTILTKEQKLAQIAEIDEMFTTAKGWGSWMATAYGARYALVESLKKWDDTIVDHRFKTENENI